MTAAHATLLVLSAIGLGSFVLIPALWMHIQVLQARQTQPPFRTEGPVNELHPMPATDAILDTLDDMALEGWWMSPGELVRLTATVRELRDEVEVLRVECVINETRGAA